MGRPCKLTDELQDIVCTNIRVGAHVETACAAVGIDPESLRNWLRRGVEAERAGRDDKFSRFRAAMNKAVAESEHALVAGIAASGTDDWRARAWILSRRFRDRWADRTELTGAGGGPIPLANIDLSKLTDAQLETVIRGDIRDIATVLAAESFGREGTATERE